MSYSHESVSSTSLPQLGESSLRHATALLLLTSTWSQSEPTTSASFKTAFKYMSTSMLANSHLEADDAEYERFECEFYTFDGNPIPLPNELHIHIRSGLVARVKQYVSKTKSLVKSLSTLRMMRRQSSETARRMSQHNDNAIDLTAGRVGLGARASEASERLVARLQMFFNNPAEEAFAAFRKARNALDFVQRASERNGKAMARSLNHEDDMARSSSQEIESMNDVREADDYRDPGDWELVEGVSLSREKVGCRCIKQHNHNIAC